MNRIPPSARSSRRSLPAGASLRGLTLVELMVALAISLVIVLAATSVYVATRESQRTLDEANSAHESGSFALRILGRELMNAGFYPAVRVESVAVANVLSEYTNITGQAAYDAGLFGCDGGVFDPVAGTCPGPTAGAPDSLVVGYFTSDAFGGSVGQRVDCAGNDVGTVLLNVARLGGVGAGTAPTQPLFVANRYALQDEVFTVEGRDVTTRSLACNGIAAGNATYQRIISGIDDLQISYGVVQDPSLAVNRYYTATEVNGLGTIDIGNGPVGPWRRVAAVRVCVIARTFETPTAIGATSAADLLRYEDCNGTQVTQPQTDRTLRKTYVQVFGVRNRQNATY